MINRTSPLSIPNPNAEVATMMSVSFLRQRSIARSRWMPTVLPWMQSLRSQPFYRTICSHSSACIALSDIEDRGAEAMAQELRGRGRRTDSVAHLTMK